MSTSAPPASKSFVSRLFPTRLERRMHRLADRLFDDIDAIREKAGLQENDLESAG